MDALGGNAQTIIQSENKMSKKKLGREIAGTQSFKHNKGTYCG